MCSSRFWSPWKPLVVEGPTFWSKKGLGGDLKGRRTGSLSYESCLCSHAGSGRHSAPPHPTPIFSKADKSLGCEPFFVCCKYLKNLLKYLPLGSMALGWAHEPTF